MEEVYRGCPFCGQALMTEDDGDPAMECSCDAALKYQKMTETVRSYCGPKCGKQSREFKPLDEEQIDGILEAAKHVCAENFASVCFVCPDGSIVTVGAKVSRKISVKREAKI